MEFTKVTVLFPNVKKVAYTGKVKYSGGVCQFKNKSGKGLGIPTEYILYQDEKYIMYKDPKRKIVKGSFEVKDGFFVDDDGIRINPEICTTSEVQGPKSKESIERGKALAAARSKKAAKSGGGKIKGGKLKLKLKR